MNIWIDEKKIWTWKLQFDDKKTKLEISRSFYWKFQLNDDISKLCFQVYFHQKVSQKSILSGDN